MASYDNIFRLGARAANDKVGPENLFAAHLAWMLSRARSRDEKQGAGLGEGGPRSPKTFRRGRGA